MEWMVVGWLDIRRTFLTVWDHCTSLKLYAAIASSVSDEGAGRYHKNDFQFRYFVPVTPAFRSSHGKSQLRASANAKASTLL